MARLLGVKKVQSCAYLSGVLAGYVEAILWFGKESHRNVRLQQNFTIDDFDAAYLKRCRAECQEFICTAGEALDASRHYTAAETGLRFWVARQQIMGPVGAEDGFDDWTALHRIAAKFPVTLFPHEIDGKIYGGE